MGPLHPAALPPAHSPRGSAGAAAPRGGAGIGTRGCREGCRGSAKTTRGGFTACPASTETSSEEKTLNPSARAESLRLHSSRKLLGPGKVLGPALAAVGDQHSGTSPCCGCRVPAELSQLGATARCEAAPIWRLRLKGAPFAPRAICGALCLGAAWWRRFRHFFSEPARRGRQ